MSDQPVNPLQVLSDCGINPFAVQLLCESILKHPKPETVEFYFPIHRADCANWRGVKIRLEPVPRTLDSFIEAVAASLEPAALAEFGEVERLVLRKHMEIVGMIEYPQVVGDPHGERAMGECYCDRCNRPYFDHPPDWRVIGYGSVPFLNVLCNGRRVKL